jgi:molybdopterin converting factor small subunit
MAIVIRFIGSIRGITDTETLSLQSKGGLSIKELIDKIANEKRDFKLQFIDINGEVSTGNALILVNGKEISILNGLETAVEDNDDVVFVPVAHGG